VIFRFGKTFLLDLYLPLRIIMITLSYLYELFDFLWLMRGWPTFGFVKPISIRALTNLQSLCDISKFWGILLLENLSIKV
jgi:hypothetical protein